MGSCLGQAESAGSDDWPSTGGGVGVGGGDDEAQAAHRALLAGLHRWCLDVSDLGKLSSEQWDVLLALLPEAESSKVKRFLRANDRSLALGSRLLQRAIVSKVFDLDFSKVDIRRTSEKKPYFAGIAVALSDSSRSSRLANWNFNVSHHGKYVAIASEPVCLCGVDVVDTKRRSNEPGHAEDYLKYFTEHFTESEWDTIRGYGRAGDDDGKLRRFYLNWGLKEAYVKALGQGLGYDLRRVSFVAGDWLNVCLEDGDPRRRCTCPRKVWSIYDRWTGSDGPGGGGGDRKSDSPDWENEENGAAMAWEGGGDAGGGGRGGGGGGAWGAEDRHGCMCGLGVATVEVDGLPRPDWSFQVFALPSGYAACVARGPPSACSRSGLEVGLISDPNVAGEVLAQGHSLPQLRFREVTLGDIIPTEAAKKLLELERSV